MKTRAIPAQITTVEDRIAGNLNLTQIVLLMVPVFWLMVVYSILPHRMHLSLYKVPLIVFVALLCVTLALRIKGKVVLHWLVILLKYNTRPTYYLYEKNESYLRDIVVPIFKEKPKKLFTRANATQQEKTTPTIVLADLARLENFVTNPKVSFSIRTGRKGGLNVAIEQNQK